MTDDKKVLIQQQAEAARKMWAAVVLAALDDAIKENRKSRSGDQGTEYLRRWMKSRDGHEVMSNAGIEPNARAWNGMVQYVELGVPTSTGLNQNAKKG